MKAYAAKSRWKQCAITVLQLVAVLVLCAFLPPTPGRAATGVTVSGSVLQNGSSYYPDGVLVYVKLVQSGSVVAVATPDHVTGAYSFTSVSAGSYSVVLSNNSDPTYATASTALINKFNTPSSGSQTITVAAANLTGINFTVSYACSCGYGDGRLTTGVSIPMTTNGDLSAWGNVTSDSDNNSCDSTSPDRDAPIQSTGRDLLQFSYTYDSNALYGYTTRVASESNTDNFIYYADTNNNGLMEAGEPVIYVGWQGSNRTVSVGVGQYVPSATGGDPLASPTSGLADGYKMPGSISNGRQLYSGSWGSNTGTAMQWYVRWSDMGVTAGTVIRWHISSTNTNPTSGSLAAQIDDNMGGCGGCVASNQYGGVTVDKSTNAVAASQTTVYLPHTITNAGNGTDTFTLSTTTSGAWTPSSVTYYKDNGTVGVYEPGVDTVITNSGAMLSGASQNILIAVTSPPGALGSDTVTFKATSSYIPTCGTGGTSASATATDTIRIGNIVSGTVYNDANHNGSLDSGETGTAQTLYVKLVSGSTLIATATVDPATGAYTFPAEPSGNYTIVLSNNNLATSLTATYPSGWVPVAPNSGTISISLASDTASQNFALFHGSSISSGVVFNDIGGPYPPSTAVATANNGIQDSAAYEAGMQNVTVSATDSTGSTIYDSATSDASGRFSLFVPYTATSLTIKKTPIANTQATGGTVGSTAGTYSRSAESITSINPVAGTIYSGVSFGSVPANTLSNDNTSVVQAGSSTYYPHTFTVGTLGTVTFTTSAIVNPAQPAWTESIYRDKNCTGIFDSTNDTLISGVQAITTPGPFCILVKETVPSGVSGTNTVNVTANFTYTNASPALSNTYTRTDTTTAGYTISGSVYGDANHNSTKDSGEVGTGLSLYAKLVKTVSGTPTVIAVAAVDTSTSGAASGSYTFASQPQAAGSYTIVLSTNNSTSDATVLLPSAWLPLQNGSGSIGVALSSADSTSNNFGFYNGSSVSGIVFLDDGAGGGTANDGINQAGENGLASVTVTATNGTTVYDTQTTNASGAFTVWLPSSATSVTITRVATTGYLATGGSQGSTGGTYSRTLETVTLTNVPGTGYTGVLFGDVPVNTLSNDNSGSLQQGNSTYYSHKFVSGTSGSVTFTTTAVSNPTLSGWLEAIYIDSNCNGAYDSGEPLATTQSVIAGSTVCILLKETSPSTGTAQNSVTVQATMTYANAAPALTTTVTRQDVTSSATGPVIRIQKSVDKTQAYPGDTLTYTVTYTNIGGFPAQQMVITDSVPSSTSFVSATCNTPLPSSLTGCSVTQAPAVGGSGNVTWTFTGSLSPNGTGSITFQVRVK